MHSRFLSWLVITLHLAAMLFASVGATEVCVVASAMSILLVSLYTLSGINRREKNAEFHIAYLMLSMFWLMCMFAVLYWLGGLVEAGVPKRVNFRDALYFSVTTWTTLGYGDFTPPPHLRLVTSVEALLGSLSTGIFIGAIAKLATSNQHHAPDPKLNPDDQ